MAQRDTSLDALLDLHGQILVIDDAGYWVKFVVHQVPASPEKPHGLDYSLTMHAPDGDRLVGFDNAHPVAGRARGTGQDHRHRMRTVTPYQYTDASALLAAFWTEVESLLRAKGVWT